MNDVFLSYDSKDRAVAQRLADALEGLGWSVWRDREIPFGKAFDLVIEEQLNAARCVIVVWSKESVRSRWVKTEAAVAAERDCLVPLLIDDTPIPLEFKRIQTAMMQGWNGDTQHPEFVRLVDAIRGMLGAAARPPEPSIGYLKWKLADQDGVEIFNTCLGCSNPGAQTLRKGGAHTLRIGNETDPGTGVYRLQITNVAGSGGG